MEYFSADLDNPHFSRLVAMIKSAKMVKAASDVIPLSKRPQDVVILVFFWVNLIFITYMVDVEQLIIDNPDNFRYPLWPPAWMIDLTHWWGRNFDPVLIARPVWWKMTIWIDSLFFGPFYIVAIYAYTKGRDWIRLPSVIYASVMLTNVTIILGEEAFGPHRSPRLGMVLFANASWVLFPVYIIYRMWRNPNPFTRQ
jgi:hypothetical protein